MEDKTRKAVSAYIYSIAATSYEMAFIHADEEAGKAKVRLTYLPDQLLKAVGYMKKMNMDNYHIYCRPSGFQYILLDDIDPTRLDELNELKPCLIIETSPNNYQAWLKLKDCPADYEAALNITRTLQVKFNTDKAAVSPKQVGRLPGYTNRKLKYRNDKGYFPFVKIKHCVNQHCLFTLSGPACSAPDISLSFERSKDANIANSNIEQQSATKIATSSGNSQSEVDFAIACRMIREGKQDWEISNRLEQNLAGRRKGKYYVKKTIENARKAVARQRDYS